MDGLKKEYRHYSFQISQSGYSWIDSRSAYDVLNTKVFLGSSNVQFFVTSLRAQCYCNISGGTAAPGLYVLSLDSLELISTNADGNNTPGAIPFAVGGTGITAQKQRRLYVSQYSEDIKTPFMIENGFLLNRCFTSIKGVDPAAGLTYTGSIAIQFSLDGYVLKL
jgi:hypothetical protein